MTRSANALSKLLPYVLIVGATVAALYIFLGLGAADLTAPLSYDVDSRLMAVNVKSTINTGWYLVDPNVGFPGTLDLRDFPMADGLHFVFVRIFALFTRSWPVIINGYFLLGFVLVALAALWSLRHMGVSTPVAFALALLYAFQPYHWTRGTVHWLLSAYYLVPFTLAFVLACDGEEPPLLRRDEDGRFGLDLRGWRTLAVVALAVGVGSAGVYYALFAGFLLVVVAVIASIRRRQVTLAIPPAFFIGVMVLTLLVNIIPTIISTAQRGSNPVSMTRSPRQAEVYGLRINQLLLPADAHRIPAFAALKAGYRKGLQNLGPYWDNEASGASIGIVASLGFLVLALWLIFAPARAPGAGGGLSDRIEKMSRLTVAMLLFATTAGFSAVFAILLPQIRGYNRMSIFIAFLALATVGLAIDRAAERIPDGRKRAVAVVAIATVIAILGLLDQTPAGDYFDNRAAKASFASDRAFTAAIERELPKGSKILQLPYSAFPEPGGALFGMPDYAHLSGYLTSDAFVWSYGAMKGREADVWQKQTAALPVSEMLKAAKAKGFDALWVDSRGYEDGGSAMREELARLLGAPVAVDADGAREVYVIR